MGEDLCPTIKSQTFYPVDRGDGSDLTDLWCATGTVPDPDCFPSAVDLGEAISGGDSWAGPAAGMSLFKTPFYAGIGQQAFSPCGVQPCYVLAVRTLLIGYASVCKSVREENLGVNPNTLSASGCGVQTPPPLSDRIELAIPNEYLTLPPPMWDDGGANRGVHRKRTIAWLEVSAGAAGTPDCACP